MKKFISGFISGAILCGGIALAANYSAVPATFKIFVNGKEFASDPPALVVDGRTYLPLRTIGEALGIPVNWNERLGQVEVGEAPAETYVTLDDAVKAILPIAHAEHDTDYWTVSDTYYDILEENSEAYMVILALIDNKEAINALAVIDPNNYIVAMEGADYVPYYIIEKGTGKLLGGGALQDEWEGILNDHLYGDGTQGSSGSSASNQKIDPIEAAIAEQGAIDKAINEFGGFKIAWVGNLSNFGMVSVLKESLNSNITNYKESNIPGYVYVYGFFRSSISGLGNSLIYAVDEVTDEFMNAQNASGTFNGIRMKKENGILYFYVEDLERLGLGY